MGDSAEAGWTTRVGCSAGTGWTTRMGCSAGAGWATGVSYSACGTRGCEAWARLDNVLGSHRACSDMARVVGLGWHGSGRGDGAMDLTVGGYRGSHCGGCHGGASWWWCRSTYCHI